MNKTNSSRIILNKHKFETLADIWPIYLLIFNFFNEH